MNIQLYTQNSMIIFQTKLTDFDCELFDPEILRRLPSGFTLLNMNYVTTNNKLSGKPAPKLIIKIHSMSLWLDPILIKRVLL